MVEVVCYGKVKAWDKREDAIKFYAEAMRCCDPSSSEHARYFKVWCELCDGYDFCTDEE